MYDRLGDMLSDALESGNFFAERAAAEPSVADESPAKAEKQAPVRRLPEKMSSRLLAACKVLELDGNAGAEEAKKAYHKKLKYYHPDRHGDNPVLQKVARDKTRQVLEAWETLRPFFEK